MYTASCYSAQMGMGIRFDRIPPRLFHEQGFLRYFYEENA